MDTPLRYSALQLNALLERLHTLPGDYLLAEVYNYYYYNYYNYLLLVTGSLWTHVPIALPSAVSCLLWFIDY